ncbi:hypothetical protein [Bacillus phage YungSlug]|nr:hypothetical protein [Bacillus phage YungSlug]
MEALIEVVFAVAEIVIDILGATFNKDEEE